MGRPRKINDDDAVRRLFDAGKSDAEIGVYFGVSATAIRVHRTKKMNPARFREEPRAREIPWTLGTAAGPTIDRLREHFKERRGRGLTMEEQLARGIYLSPAELRNLREWREYMDGANEHGVRLVVRKVEGRNPRPPVRIVRARDDEREYVRDPEIPDWPLNELD